MPALIHLHDTKQTVCTCGRYNQLCTEGRQLLEASMMEFATGHHNGRTPQDWYEVHERFLKHIGQLRKSLDTEIERNYDELERLEGTP